MIYLNLSHSLIYFYYNFYNHYLCVFFDIHIATPNRVRREARGYVSQTSSVTEAASDEVDLEMEPERVTT